VIRIGQSGGEHHVDSYPVIPKTQETGGGVVRACHRDHPCSDSERRSSWYVCIVAKNCEMGSDVIFAGGNATDAAPQPFSLGRRAPFPSIQGT